MHFLKVNKEPTNALTIQCIGTQYSPTCFGTLKCHHQGVKHDPAETDAQCRVKQIRMGAVYCNRRHVVIPAITPPVTIYSSHPYLLSTTLGTCLSRIMFDSLMMTFYSAETCRRILSTNSLNYWCICWFFYLPHSECVFVPLGIQHAICMYVAYYCTVTYGLSGCTIFFQII
jgi:hypothetical protein